MNRPCSECWYCGEPATHEDSVAGLFGEEMVPVCAECAFELAELRGVTTSSDAP